MVAREGHGSELPLPSYRTPASSGASVLGAKGHICAFFDSREEEYRVLLPFIKEGLESGERAFHVVDPGRRDHHLSRLADGGIDVPEAERRDQFELRDWSQAHLRQGRFDPDSMLALALEAVEFARARGFRGTRFVSHMEWALTDGTGIEAVAEYEAKANFSVPAEGDPVVCVYDLRRWGGQALVDIIRTHPRIIIGGLLHENPFFVPPDEFLRELRQRRHVERDA